MPIVIDSDGSSTVMTGSGRGSSGSASVSPIVISAMPGDRDDLAGPGLLGVDAVERLGDVELGDLRALDRAVGAAPGDLLAAADRAVAHAAEREAADVGRGVEVRDERLQRDARGRAAARGCARAAGRTAARGRCRSSPLLEASYSARRARPWRCSRRSGTRSGSRRRRGRGTARRPRRRPRRCARRGGRPC